LQTAFETFLRSTKAKKITANTDRVDVRYHDVSLGPALAEIKPTEPQTVRFAVRAAIGQLLDYHQRHGGEPRLLIVISCEPSHSDDLDLALDNGFGVAWQAGKQFEVRWPAVQAETSSSRVKSFTGTSLKRNQAVTPA
jgi:hypothetical protein